MEVMLLLIGCSYTKVVKRFNCLFESSKVENIKQLNFAKHAESLGAIGENVKSINELEQAFTRAKKSKSTYVISIKTDGYQWLEGSAFGKVQH